MKILAQKGLVDMRPGRGTIVIDGANAAMQFNQLVIAPYIGDGSPVTQSLWIDSLTVATARP